MQPVIRMRRSPHTEIRNSESAEKKFFVCHQRHSNDHSDLVIPISQRRQLLSSIQYTLIHSHQPIRISPPE
jgi:hypothetical protein